MPWAVHKLLRVLSGDADPVSGDAHDFCPGPFVIVENFDSHTHLAEYSLSRRCRHRFRKQTFQIGKNAFAFPSGSVAGDFDPVIIRKRTPQFRRLASGEAAVVCRPRIGFEACDESDPVFPAQENPVFV